jgi:two-component system response regulator DctR
MPAPGPSARALAGTVHLVDDEAVVRDALGWLLRTRRLYARPHESGDAFLAALPGLPHDDVACVLLDVRMPGASGLAVFEEILASGRLGALPVIFLTGHGEVSTAVDAVKRGAFDFIEKPFVDNQLVARVLAALEASASWLAAQANRSALSRRMADLTDREQEVMRCVVAGLANKQIADELSISVRTVEVHRARVFDKMGVRSAVELANLMRHTEP